MTFKEAETLITEAHKLGYRGTDWEQGFITQLETRHPYILTNAESQSVIEFYRRAANGGKREKHQIINCKHRFNPGE